MAIFTIDAGHGGSDPGACNPTTGTRECDIALAVTFELKGILEGQGHEVHLTRSTDVDVYGPDASVSEECGARCDISNAANSDVCISIHCNAFSDPSAHGTETFAYANSPRGAQLAQAIDANLVALGLTARNTDKFKPLYMTKHPDAVAVLVELAFITNPAEEQLLLTRQWALANCIALGVNTYLA